MNEGELKKVNMNDHDLLIRLSTQMEMLINEFKLMKDGTQAKITALEAKVVVLEKEDARIDDQVKNLESRSSERARMNKEMIENHITESKGRVLRNESNTAYWFRLVIEKAIVPAAIFVGTLLLIKTGILNI